MKKKHHKRLVGGVCNIAVLTKLFLVAVMAVLTFASCSDDENFDDGGGTGDEPSLVISRSCDDYTYDVTSDKAWKADVDGDWLSLYTTSGNGPATLKFYAEENGEPDSRTATIRITEEDGTKTDVRIKQAGMADGEDNSLGGGVFRKHAVCWGYNGYGFYADASGLKGQIVNEKKAVEIMNRIAEGEESVSMEKYEVVENVESVGTSSEDYSESLGVNAGFDLDLPCGFSMGIKGEFSMEELSSSNKNFSKRRHKAIKYYKTMSVENLMAVMTSDDKQMELLKDSILTLGFRSAVKKLKNAIAGKGKPADEELGQFINTFGTHIVVSAQLGGYFDYTMTTEKSNITSKLDIKAGLDMGYKDMFSISGDASYDRVKKKIGENYTCKVKVVGGQAGILSAATNGQKGGCTNEDILKWENTITEKDALLIDHQLLAIWNIIPDEEVAEAVKSYLKTGKYVKANTQYELPMPKSDVTGAVKIPLSDFKNELDSVNGTLVYYVEAGGSYVAEICHEQINAISQERVFVVYPIVKNKPDYTNGFFIGDGVHVPGYVEWNDKEKDYSYKVAEGYDVGDVIDTVYARGEDHEMRFYGKNPAPESKWVTAAPQPSYARYFRIPESKMADYTCYCLSDYDIVKVGRHVWFREELQTVMGFNFRSFVPGAYEGKFFYRWEIVEGGIDTPQWRLPTEDDFKELKKLANTSAPFIKGGTTGLDINVKGEYTDSWGLNKECPYYFLLAANNKCIRIDMADASEMMIGSVSDLSLSSKSYLPVRLIRTDNFQYEKAETYTK